jgi:hypothetical protein
MTRYWWATVRWYSWCNERCKRGAQCRNPGRQLRHGAIPAHPKLASCSWPRPLGARLAQAVRLRNILVRGYLDINHGRPFDELDWIESTEEFAAAIEQWLEQNVNH